MQFFSKSQYSKLTVCALLFISNAAWTQSRMEYGIGVGLIYGDYQESRNLPDGLELVVDQARFSPSVNTYVAYKATDRLKLTSSPGINFHLHNEPLGNRNLSSVYFHLPVGVQYKLVGNLSVMGDVFYDYLVNQSYVINDESVSVTNLVDTRNLYGASAGLAYSIGRYMEIQLTASHHFNSVNSYILTDLNGVEAGDVKLRNRFLKLNLVFRG